MTNLTTTTTDPLLSTASRIEWDRAMSAYLNAKAEADAFDATYDTIREAWEAGQPSTDTILWEELHFADRNHVLRTMDLEAHWSRYLEGEGKWWFAGSEAARERMIARQRAALDSVKAYREAVAAHNRESGMDEANDRSDALGDAQSEADTALMNTPAPDLAALRWKLERFPDPDGGLESWTAQFVGQTFADIARLLPEAG